MIKDYAKRMREENVMRAIIVIEKLFDAVCPVIVVGGSSKSLSSTSVSPNGVIGEPSQTIF